MNEALRITPKDLTHVAAELRRLHALNAELEAELMEQARVNGMGSEREARLMALNAELVEALRWCIRQMPEPVLPGEYTEGFKVARAALANSKVNLEGKAK